MPGVPVKRSKSWSLPQLRNPVKRNNSQTLSQLHRRRGTTTPSGNAKMHMILFAGMAVVGALVVGIFIGILFVGGGNPSAVRRVDSPAGLLRGAHLRQQWNDKAEKFKKYLHENEENGEAELRKGEYPYMVEAPPHNYIIAASWKPPGGKRFSEYADGSSPYHISDEMRLESDKLARARREFVKTAMEFAWDGYRNYAFGMDELLPASRRGTNTWGGFGVTLVDSLDSLWLMGMKTQFYEARDWVRDSLRHDKARAVSVFETTIRSLGGLLSAYDWSGDTVFLNSALDLARRLIRSFDSSPSGIPFGQVNLATGAASNIEWAGNNAILAEFGTMQLEFRWLDAFVKTPETARMRRKVEHVFEILNEMSPANGLYPYYINNARAPSFASNHVTFGAMADSFYEYMLKVWIQGGKLEPMYRDMYDKAIQGMHDELLQVSEPSGLTFIADKIGNMLDEKQVGRRLSLFLCPALFSGMLTRFTPPYRRITWCASWEDC
jgi:Glycosyl hydrolase family 47